MPANFAVLVFLRVLDYGQAWKAMLLAPREAILLAIDLAAAASKPVIVADVQDNAGAGADSNTTGLLHALLATGAGRRWPGQIAIGLINDPEAALTATNAGVGAAVQMAVGKSVAAFDGTQTEPPVQGRFKVIALHNGPVVLQGPMMHGVTVDPGPSACLEIEGVLVAVSSAKTQMLDRSLYQMMGIEPSRMKIVVNKSAVHFRADFEPISASIVLVRSPGPMAADPADFPWTGLRPGLSPTIPGDRIVR